MAVIYLGWAIYIAAAACHLLYWRVAPGVLALKRVGMEGLVGANLYPLVAISQAALFLWPFVAAATLMSMYSPHIFTVLLMWFGALGVAFVISFFGSGILAGWLGHAPRPDEALTGLAASLALACLVSSVCAFGFALFAKDGNPYY